LARFITTNLARAMFFVFFLFCQLEEQSNYLLVSRLHSFAKRLFQLLGLASIANDNTIVNWGVLCFALTRWIAACSCCRFLQNESAMRKQTKWQDIVEEK
jgi:hypothetical protein